MGIMEMLDQDNMGSGERRRNPRRRSRDLQIEERKYENQQTKPNLNQKQKRKQLFYIRGVKRLIYKCLEFFG